MKSTRRMGPAGSAIWSAMLDAAEQILCEEGYGALTSRRVAERIGVKQRLVYYYFRTMEDLIVETFRRGAVRELDRLNKALETAQPLRAIWAVYIDTVDVRLISEFMALANRIEALRVEVKDHIEKSRRIQVAALTKALDRRTAGTALPPIAAAIFATSAALSLHREARIGIRAGHAEIKSVIDGYIGACDRSATAPAGSPKRRASVRKARARRARRRSG